MKEVEITTEMVKNQCRKIPNWKTPGRDGIQGYWIKNLTSVHERIAAQLNEIACGVSRLPEWMMYGRTVLCQKDPTKGGAVDNYRPISCLQYLRKVLGHFVLFVFCNELSSPSPSETMLVFW